MKFLALGDSYTIGEGVESAERWPVQLAAALRARGETLDDPLIIATTGWTTDELAAGMASRAPSGTFDLVTLLIGVNNQYRGRSLEEYRTQFEALLSTAIGYAGGVAARVLVLSIPDWGVTPFAEGRDRAAVAAAIDAFNSEAAEIVGERGARWVDITPISRERHEGWEAADGLHPSGAQYARWATAAMDAAAAALRV